MRININEIFIPYLAVATFLAVAAFGTITAMFFIKIIQIVARLLGLI